MTTLIDADGKVNLTELQIATANLAAKNKIDNQNKKLSVCVTELNRLMFHSDGSWVTMWIIDFAESIKRFDMLVDTTEASLIRSYFKEMSEIPLSDMSNEQLIEIGYMVTKLVKRNAVSFDPEAQRFYMTGEATPTSIKNATIKAAPEPVEPKLPWYHFDRITNLIGFK